MEKREKVDAASKEVFLEWFLFWSEQDKACIKAEPFQGEGSFAYWISQDEFSFVWSAGYGDEDLGEHDDLREAINACQRDANKRSTQKPRPTRGKGGGKR